jgi:TNF receptor-associated protein 1
MCVSLTTYYTRSHRHIRTHATTYAHAHMNRKQPDKYKGEFWHEYGFFLKEGICQDYEFQEPLSKLLYFETNKSPGGALSSLEEYVSRCTPTQKDIYFLCAPNRDLALSSPYLEGFKDREVLLVYSAIDDFVLTNLTQFQSRTFVNAEKGDLDVIADDSDSDDNKSGDDDKDKDSKKKKLSGQEADEFCAWFKLAVNDKIDKVKMTNRLDSSPAVVTDHESGALRRMMKMVDTTSSSKTDTMMAPDELPKQTVELNPKHAIILGMNAMRHTEPEIAQVLAEQIFDNCLVAAGLLDDSRSMLPRLNDLLLCVIKEVGTGEDKEANSDKEAKLVTDTTTIKAETTSPTTEGSTSTTGSKE